MLVYPWKTSEKKKRKKKKDRGRNIWGYNFLFLFLFNFKAMVKICFQFNYDETHSNEMTLFYLYKINMLIFFFWKQYKEDNKQIQCIYKWNYIQLYLFPINLMF